MGLTMPLRVYFVLLLSTLAFSCSHHANRAEKLNSNLEKSDLVTKEEVVGLNKDGDMVWQKKVSMNEELRRIQNEVYDLEDRVYGNRKYNSTGLYGALKTCDSKLAAKENGGNGQIMWTEPLDRITDKEEIFNIGLDEKERLVGVSVEFLKDRIARFIDYKRVLMKKEDEFDDKLSLCRGEMKSRTQAKKSVDEPGRDLGTSK
jgi:hypothetical protein